jgi:cytochrome c oxidase subunit 3
VPARRPAEQFEDLEKQAYAARLGMWVFLGSEILLFLGLFTLYGGYRALYPRDFAAAAAHNDVAIGTINTVVLITSSLAVAMSVGAVRAGRPRSASRLLALGIGCGLVFLSLKGVEYAAHFAHGIFPGAGYRFAELPGPGARMFFTTYYSMTFLHALHVVAGMVILAWLAVGARRGRYTPSDHVHVEAGALYWHLVDVIWIFLWPLLYLGGR